MLNPAHGYTKCVQKPARPRHRLVCVCVCESVRALVCHAVEPMQCQVRSRSVSHSDKRVAVCTCHRRACSCTASTKPPISTICLTGLLLFFFFILKNACWNHFFFTRPPLQSAPGALETPRPLRRVGENCGADDSHYCRIPPASAAQSDWLPPRAARSPSAAHRSGHGRKKKTFFWEVLWGWKSRAGNQRTTHLFLERLNPLFLTSDCLLQLQKKPPLPMLKTEKKPTKKNIQGTYLSKASCSSCCFNRARWHFRIKRKTKNETGCSLLQGVTPRS